MMTTIVSLIAMFATLTASADTLSPKPNILLILADDLGFSDLGCYGGEIATPNLDALAQGGLRFTQFYNTARCWPSRAAILTGYYAQQVRRDTVPGVASGTGGTRPVWAPLLPELLRPLGYRSYHSGKWHIDGKPLQNGFDHSYSLNDHDRYFAPQMHTVDDIPLPAVKPGSGYYATTAMADYAIKCLQEHAAKYAKQPFFQYLAFTSPHFPVQAPAADIARYHDRYLAGWDVIREERWQTMRQLGIGGDAISAIERNVGPPYDFPESIEQLGPDEVNRPLPWADLNAAQRKFQAEKMSVHAAMVDRMDREIGRVLAQIRAMGALDNTIVLFLSDNGASAEMMVRGDGNDQEAQCGTGATFRSIGPGWSSMANTPFRRHKTWVHEGGISTPLIVHWPQGIAARGELRQTPGHIVDLVPTLMTLAGGKPPEIWGNQAVPPAPGKSLVPQFAKDGTVVHESIWWMHEGNRALRAGNWKVVAAGKDSPWELYDLSRDRSESVNLALRNPAKVQELAADWRRQTEEYTELAKKDQVATYEGWKHSGSLYVITTREGANLPAEAVVTDFPLLVRLDQDSFNFAQAQTNGADIRFSASTGGPLPYQVEEWNPAQGKASVWVRVPMIKGNTRQELKVHWGKPDAVSESAGAKVFGKANGYLSVWHMDGTVRDEAGSVDLKDTGTTSSEGVIGRSRHFTGGEGHGLASKDPITNYPTGYDSHSSEAWFRIEKPNATILAWGNEHAQGKVVMQFRSPPHLAMDCYFSDGNVQGLSALPLSKWTHVVHTYEKGHSKLYVNGVLDGSSTRTSSPLAIKSPAQLWIGGWYDNYDFQGDMDEVRISRVARSADWVKLEFENQKPKQTLVGTLVQPGSSFSVSPAEITVMEGKSVSLSAEAGGAQKVYWSLKGDTRDEVAAVDRLSFIFEAGRVSGNKSVLLQFKAIYPNEVRTKDIPITIQENIPEPEFTLRAPAHWDGRRTIEVIPSISNLQQMRAKDAADLQVSWNVKDIAVTKEAVPGKLILTRAQNSGTIVVTATIDNGGKPVSRSLAIEVNEPKRDAWVVRKPEKDEKPENNQFYARDDRNAGTLFYNGTLEQPADAVFLKVYADDQLFRSEQGKLKKDKSYEFSVKLKPGLIHYKVEFGFRKRDQETLLNTVTNVVCGDAFVIDGQSNAVATDWGEDEPKFRSEWIRTFGSMSGNPEGVRLWGEAMYRSRDEEKLQIGYWGMELARRLLEAHQIPICIINGAVGGTRVDQHQRNPKNSEDMETIYGRLLWRVHQARLTQGIRGIFWHQGENDQGADGPTGGFGWENYRQFFIDIAGAWKQDYPNVQHYHVFQIWPKSCSMGIDGSDNRLREVQRALPSAFSKMGIMSTLGIHPAGECHYPAAGYAEMARLIFPLVERDHYGRTFTASITPPNLVKAYYANAKQEEAVMEFDQPMRWVDTLASQFYVDGESGKVASGLVLGKNVTLKLNSPSKAKTLTYLDSKSWSQSKLLYGDNGIAALTFCEVPLKILTPR